MFIRSHIADSPGQACIAACIRFQHATTTGWRAQLFRPLRASAFRHFLPPVLSFRFRCVAAYRLCVLFSPSGLLLRRRSAGFRFGFRRRSHFFRSLHSAFPGLCFRFIRCWAGRCVRYGIRLLIIMFMHSFPLQRYSAFSIQFSISFNYRRITILGTIILGHRVMAGQVNGDRRDNLATVSHHHR